MTGVSNSLQDLIEMALAEDVGGGDYTTRWTVPESMGGRARVLAGEEGVISGTEAASGVFRAMEPDLTVDSQVDDGDAVRSGSVLLEVRGPLRGILTAERTALNFLARLSGIATLSRRFVDAVDDTGCSIADTRKTTPGWRRLEKAATRAGGAENHRFGLDDMILVKENHVRAAGGVRPALDRVLPQARARGLKVEVEVEDLRQVEEALGKRPDRILLDNMTPAELREAVDRVERFGGPRPQLEASGGVTLDTVRRIAETGVDLISVGALTHSAPALDVTLLVDRVENR